MDEHQLQGYYGSGLAIKKTKQKMLLELDFMSFGALWGNVNRKHNIALKSGLWAADNSFSAVFLVHLFTL